VFRKQISSVPPNFLKFYNSYKIATFFDLKCFTCKSFILSVVFRKNFSWSVVFRNSKRLGTFFDWKYAAITDTHGYLLLLCLEFKLLIVKILIMNCNLLLATFSVHRSPGWTQIHRCHRKLYFFQRSDSAPSAESVSRGPPDHRPPSRARSRLDALLEDGSTSGRKTASSQSLGRAQRMDGSHQKSSGELGWAFLMNFQVRAIQTDLRNGWSIEIKLSHCVFKMPV